jgi:hypothetical protein
MHPGLLVHGILWRNLPVKAQQQHRRQATQQDSADRHEQP